MLYLKDPFGDRTRFVEYHVAYFGDRVEVICPFKEDAGS